LTILFIYLKLYFEAASDLTGNYIYMRERMSSLILLLFTII